MYFGVFKIYKKKKKTVCSVYNFAFYDKNGEKSNGTRSKGII